MTAPLPRCGLCRRPCATCRCYVDDASLDDAALPWEQAWEPDAETLARHDRAEALAAAHAAVERMAARRESRRETDAA